MLFTLPNSLVGLVLMIGVATAAPAGMVKPVSALVMGQQSVFPFEPLLHNVTQAEQFSVCYHKLVNTAVTCPRDKVLQQSHQEKRGCRK